METKYDIFISYRRDGGDKYARTIQQALEKQYRVFLDFDELKDGVFDRRIMDAISQSSVFLLLLTKGALDRCVNEGDWVREEILHAGKCNCHIVPVNIDDSFDGIPECLPEELKALVGAHQFSELQTKTLFKASMSQLINYRIAPYIIQKQETATGAEIHIESDADCQLFHFKNPMRVIHAGNDEVVHLKRGKHKLEFVSVEYEEIKDMHILEIPDEDYTDFLEIKMKKRVEEKWGEEEAMRKAEEETRRRAEEEARVKAEEENKRKIEEEARRKAIESARREDEAEAKRKATKDSKKQVLQSVKYTWPWIISIVGVFTWVLILTLSKMSGDNIESLSDSQTMQLDTNTWKRIGNFSEGLAIIKGDNQKYGYIDTSMTVVIPCKWKVASDFHEGTAQVIGDNYKYGFIDKTGKVVIPCKWKYVHSFLEGLAVVEDDHEKWGFIDKTGEVVISCTWFAVSRSFFGGNACVLDYDFQPYTIDKSGKIVKGDADSIIVKPKGKVIKDKVMEIL